MQICPRGCHITDRGKDICPRCGGFMKEMEEKDFNKIMQNVQEFQRSNGNDTAKGRHLSNKQRIV